MILCGSFHHHSSHFPKKRWSKFFPAAIITDSCSPTSDIENCWEVLFLVGTGIWIHYLLLVMRHRKPEPILKKKNILPNYGSCFRSRIFKYLNPISSSENFPIGQEKDWASWSSCLLILFFFFFFNLAFLLHQDLIPGRQALNPNQMCSTVRLRSQVLALWKRKKRGGPLLTFAIVTTFQSSYIGIRNLTVAERNKPEFPHLHLSTDGWIS